MYLRICYFSLLIISLNCLKGNAQTYNDGTIEYDVFLIGNKDSLSAQFLKNAYMVLYIRGHQSRSELHTSLGSTTTIYDEKNGNAIILNEYGGQRIMVRLSSDQYQSIHKKYRNEIGRAHV